MKSTFVSAGIVNSVLISSSPGVLCKDEGNVNQLGLFDLDRKITPVGQAYKNLISQWKEVLVAESFELNF